MRVRALLFFAERVQQALPRLALAVVALVVNGCSPCTDVQKYDPGTTFRVTVIRAFSGCHVTFGAGAAYSLVAGPVTQMPQGEGASCGGNPATAPPSFTTSEYTVQRCGADSQDGSMGLLCVAELSTCPAGETTQLDLSYTKLPESPGDRVDSVLNIRNSTNPDCPAAVCNANIPVTIAW
jgi:hypothetical protein